MVVILEKIKDIIIILLAICFFSALAFRNCSKQEYKPIVSQRILNIDSLQKIRDLEIQNARKEEQQIAYLKYSIEKQDSIVYIYRDRWYKDKDSTPKEIKKNPVVRKLINDCDSLKIQDSISIAERDLLNSKKDIIITYWHTAHSNDSLIIKSFKMKNDSVVDVNSCLKQENKSLKRKVVKEKVQKWVAVILLVAKEGMGLVKK